MDKPKCDALKSELSAQPEPQIVSIERFFDGNDDLGSIGCNLLEHPGIESFRQIFMGLMGRPDVEAVYAQISELDPGEGSWPFSDVVLIVGSISSIELNGVLAMLQPDDVGPAADFANVSAASFAFVGKKHKAPVLAAWWD